MKVLVWRDKHGDAIYNATDEEKAYLRLFGDMEESDYWVDSIAEESPYWKSLYASAKGGDAIAARLLCMKASDWEYQYNELVEVIDP
jgi:hypothetical protein